MAGDGNRTACDALSGIRVLDFSQLIAGPTCTRMMADMGAEVIKIEPPPSGDGGRALPAIKEGVSGLFMQYNAGKKSLCMNLKTAGAIEIVKKLIPLCDVVVENFKVGVMDRMGLAYPVLREIHPGLIMCSISGYGQTGPNRDRPSVAATIHADAGVTHIFGRRSEGEMEPGPHNLSLSDTVAGYHAFGAILTALFHRERTGAGQHIDISLYDSLFFTIDYQVEHYLMTGQEPPAVWGATPVRGRDGYIVVGLAKYDLFLRLLRCMGLEADERFSSMERIVQNSMAFKELAEKWVLGFESVEEVEAIVREAGIPVSRVKTVVEAAESKQVESRGMLREIDHPRIGKVRVMNTPFRFSGIQSGLRGRPPELGEHNAEVMAGLLGLTGREIEGLYAEGILFAPS